MYEPVPVDVAATSDQGAWLGWLMSSERRPDGWWGFVREHGQQSGGVWVPAARLSRRVLSDDEVRALGGFPSGPDDEPLYSSE